MKTSTRASLGIVATVVAFGLSLAAQTTPARRAAEDARHAAEEARHAAEQARHATIDAIAATADSLAATLEQMKFLEEARTTMRELKKINRTDIN